MFNSGWQEVLCCTRHVVKWAHRHDKSLRKREHCWEIISILIYFSSLSPFIICKPAGMFATKNCDHSRHRELWQPRTESQDPSQAAFYSCTLQATVCSFYLVNCASCLLKSVFTSESLHGVEHWKNPSVCASTHPCYLSSDESCVGSVLFHTWLSVLKMCRRLMS